MRKYPLLTIYRDNLESDALAMLANFLGVKTRGWQS
jgi:hypothetical protein